MSSVVVHSPAAPVRRPHGFGLNRLFRRLHRRRQAQAVFVAIVHAADIPPT